jgi:hypothetical protein
MSYRPKRAAAGALAGLALSLVLASSALAVRPDTSGWSQLTSPAGHFLVHYGSGVADADAQAAAANLDSAYATEVDGWGFPAPISGGADGKVDVYVEDTGSNLGESYHDDYTAPTTSGYILLSPASATNASAAAHELFHLIQYAIYAHGAKFLVEGTAEWAAANVTGSTGWLFTYWANPEQPLDCLAGSACAPTPDQDHSYSRWLFFEHLSEHYGPGIVREILTPRTAARSRSSSTRSRRTTPQPPTRSPASPAAAAPPSPLRRATPAWPRARSPPTRSPSIISPPAT